MATKSEKRIDKETKTKNEIRKLEEFYVTGKVDDVLSVIEEKKSELVKEMIKYAEEKNECIKWDRDGDEIAFKVNVNPIIITNKFFKSIVPINCQEPEYNAEKLTMVYDYYCDLITEVNDKIGPYPTSLTSFCKLAGITLTTLRNYRNSSDLNMRIIVEKIYDQIGDENITMSQLGKTRERSTLFKLKSQNEMVEKEQPKVNINVTELPDLERINERLNKYKNYANKKKAIK